MHAARISTVGGGTELAKFKLVIDRKGRCGEDQAQEFCRASLKAILVRQDISGRSERDEFMWSSATRNAPPPKALSKRRKVCEQILRVNFVRLKRATGVQLQPASASRLPRFGGKTLQDLLLRATKLSMRRTAAGRNKLSLCGRSSNGSTPLIVESAIA